jgi:hypothetical protein
MSKVSLQSFDLKHEEKKQTAFDNPIQSVSVAYDSGRLTVAINGAIVLSTGFAGNDFQLDIT